jgi:hypothetical protein
VSCCSVAHRGVPFVGDNFVTVAMQHQQACADVASRRRDVSPRVAAAVDRALARIHATASRRWTRSRPSSGVPRGLDVPGANANRTVINVPAPRHRPARGGASAPARFRFALAASR